MTALTARQVTVRYGRNTVLDGVDFSLPAGVTTGLAGPSGCGKSTLGLVLAMLRRPAAGTLTIDDVPVPGWRHRAPRAVRTRVAIVFQQPRLAVDPRLRLRDVVLEPLRATGRGGNADGALSALADAVGLTPELLGRRPHEVSDGQLQRACLARALALRPSYLICDEMTTMLDASTQAHLVHTVEEYRRESGAGVLAISHDQVLLDRWAAGTVTWETVVATARQERALVGVGH
ncbi:ATP-binding cassette domain-containing protein [Micromonospora polyrhachis]|uniref:Peptide/nickel transport system ATP-binding protein n=1 Tax=Micromonospora polyrhachis TaxID=1282883 RepID=A0A7W7SL47_9ACTN|nr:ATP-binding cassette domain-containing protein [Micromonospora polyrhachis]MBB4956785.1 peptide/nickel transport system ATP-binding protein [Micromonospora polyrhachis]